MFTRLSQFDYSYIILTTSNIFKNSMLEIQENKVYFHDTQIHFFTNLNGNG